MRAESRSTRRSVRATPSANRYPWSRSPYSLTSQTCGTPASRAAYAPAGLVMLLVATTCGRRRRNHAARRTIATALGTISAMAAGRGTLAVAQP